MTEQIKNIESALKKVKDQKENFGFMDRFTVDENWEVTKALEKQIPMEHHHTKIDHIVDDVRISICPSCLAVIPSHRTEYPNYCISCGQRIDWGNENDRED